MRLAIVPAHGCERRHDLARLLQEDFADGIVVRLEGDRKETPSWFRGHGAGLVTSLRKPELTLYKHGLLRDVTQASFRSRR